MLVNYLKIAIKSFLRRKFFTAISLFGIGFTLMVLLIVAAVLDFAHAPAPPETNLARTLHLSAAMLRGSSGEQTVSMTGSPGFGLLDRYARDIPGVEKFSIVSREHDVASFVNGEKIVSNLRRTDGAYWEILDFDFVEGGPFTHEDDENADFVAVINEATRRRFFGKRPALNETIEADGQRFRVVGVVRNVSVARQSAYSDIWVPHGTAKSREFRKRLHGDFWGLLLAHSRADFAKIRAEFESRLPHVEFTPPFDTLYATPLTRFEQTIVSLGNSYEGKPPVLKVLLMWLGMAAAFLLLPTVNLVSVNLTRILERSGEIGVRKAFGASSAHLIGQFIFENVLLCLIGAVLALAGAAVVIEIVESSGVVPYGEFNLNYRLFLYAVELACLFGVLSGAFPAWRMARLHPVEALRGGAR